MLAYIADDVLLNTNEIHSIVVKELPRSEGWELDLVRADGQPQESLSTFKTEKEAKV